MNRRANVARHIGKIVLAFLVSALFAGLLYRHIAAHDAGGGRVVP